jgi:curli biogenesis system outer membrane secretion channel CsgG
VYREPPKEIARLEVKRVEDDICIAQVTSTEAMSLLKVGQEIDITAAILETRYSLAVLDFYIPTLKQAVYGNYVADVVVQELQSYKTFRLYERERLNAILSEQQLGVSGLVDSQTAVELGKVIGVRYVLFGRVPVFEARESKSRVPLHGLARVGEIVTGKPMGSGLVSDIEIKQMVARVKLTGRIVDVETGEILCICDGEGNAEGEENVQFIHGVFGGMKQDSGSFRDSILGEATERASAMLAGKVAQKFNPQIRIENKK